VRLVCALCGLIFLASLFALAPNASSSAPGSQLYCSHPTHGKSGYFGPCHPVQIVPSPVRTSIIT
jgi:hypothetical protein